MIRQLFSKDSGLIWIGFWGCWGALRVLFQLASRKYGPVSIEDGLQTAWWLLALAYFIVDLVLLFIFVLLHKRLVSSDETTEGFTSRMSELVPIWVLFHLFLLLFEYQVSARLEKVGLGALEAIGFAVFLVASAGYALRNLKKTPKKT